MTVLSLGRLSRRDVATILNAGRAPGQEVAPAMVDRIVERTDGVPLFVEELALAVRHGEESAMTTVAIPSSLRELLGALGRALPHRSARRCSSRPRSGARFPTPSSAPLCPRTIGCCVRT